MKTSNLLIAILFGWILSSIVGLGIIKYEFKLFSESKPGKSFYQDLGDYRFHYDVHRDGNFHSLDEIKNAKPRAINYYSTWYWENVFIIIVLLIIPFLSMFIFTYSVLHYKYSNLFPFREIIKNSLKNRVYFILMTLYSVVYIMYLINSKYLIALCWDTFNFSL